MINDVRRPLKRNGQAIDALSTTRQDPHGPRAHRLARYIHVDYYGSSMPRSQVAGVTLADARTISVQPWEKKMIPVVEKGDPRQRPGRQSCDVRRRDPHHDAAMTRSAARSSPGRAQGREGARVAIRNIRRTPRSSEEALKDKEVSEDDERHALVDLRDDGPLHRRSDS